VCCSVLQCVSVDEECAYILILPAVIGHTLKSVLQCVAVCCSVLQCFAVCCSVLQCVVVFCRVLQCESVAVCCSA